MLGYAQRCLPRAPRHALLENRSRSTRENALHTLRLLASSPPLSRRRATLVVVVTNRFHMPRACRTFANAANLAARTDTIGGRRPRVRVRCANVPPSSRGTRASRVSRGTDDGSTDDERGGEDEWCAARSGPAEPREIAWQALREFAALLLYKWRGWL